MPGNLALTGCAAVAILSSRGNAAPASAQYAPGKGSGGAVSFVIPDVTFATGVASTYDLAQHYAGWNAATMLMLVFGTLPASVTFDGAHSLVCDGTGGSVTLSGLTATVIPLGES